MEYYKLMLLDDEEIVLMGIQKTYHMEDYGFTLAGCFSNPQKALDAVSEIRPDLIITDIRMPRMNGLEFSEQVRKRLPDTEIVILSGYDDFSYAQTAVKIGISDYLLKPIKKEDFSAMLTRMHRRIEEKHTLLENVCNLRKVAESSVGELKNYFFLELAEAPFHDNARIHSLYQSCGLDFQDSPFLLAKFDYTEASFPEDTMTALGRLEQQISAELEPFGTLETFQNDEYMFFFLYDILQDLYDAIRETLLDIEAQARAGQIDITVGISTIHQGMESLYAANLECDKWLKTNSSTHAAGSQNTAAGSAPDASAPSKLVSAVLSYIEEHFCENISLASTAEAVAISKTYLCDIFKKELGMTFVNYVTNLRIERAKELLADPTLKMYEISSAVGFNDYTYFSQIFKKRTGMTLSEYRKRY
ncbi:MAG: response regulator [Lachnospiraceae bacterium]|jgi:two-component system response regulator YesN|nr:response regulator [Lachnospiraceae bacterium]MCI1656021.1 response regulator [Lachnospiraceae bacterium]MCI2194503.1 response regulator [Lachnospiraceae bacterium]